jgi:hypothetical protein
MRATTRARRDTPCLLVSTLSSVTNGLDSSEALAAKLLRSGTPLTLIVAEPNSTELLSIPKTRLISYSSICALVDSLLSLLLKYPLPLSLLTLESCRVDVSMAQWLAILTTKMVMHTSRALPECHPTAD